MIKKITWWSSVFVAITILIYLFSLISVYMYSFKDNTRKADSIVVLGAAVWYNKPSPVFEERIKHGIWLYKKGYADKIIFTGGKYNKETPSESSIAKEYAIKNGVDEKDIYIEESSRATEQNMKNAKKIMDEHHLKTALIVSDPFHMKRSMTIASFTGITAYTSPTPNSAYHSWDTKFPFLSHEAIFLSGYVLSYPARWVDWHFFNSNKIIINYLN